MTFGFCLGTIIGIAIGVCLGIIIVLRQVKKSNDLGDSKAGFNDFSVSNQVKIISSEDRINKNEFSMVVHGQGPYHKKGLSCGRIPSVK